MFSFEHAGFSGSKTQKKTVITAPLPRRRSKTPVITAQAPPGRSKTPAIAVLLSHRARNLCSNKHLNHKTAQKNAQGSCSRKLCSATLHSASLGSVHFTSCMDMHHKSVIQSIFQAPINN